MEIKYFLFLVTSFLLMNYTWGIATTASPTTKAAELPCEPMDVIFLLDTSASIDDALFKDYPEFLQSAIAHIMSISVGTRIGIIGFNTYAKAVHKLSDSQTPFAIFRSIERFSERVPCGLSFIDTALERATDMFLLERRPTGDAKRIVILLSDGNMTQRNNKANSYYLAFPLRLLEKLKAQVFVVSIGDSVDVSALAYIIRNQANKQLYTFGMGGTFLKFLEKAKLNCKAAQKPLKRIQSNEVNELETFK